MTSVDRTLRRFFGFYKESLYICLNLHMTFCSTDTMSFTTDIEVSLLTAVNQVGLIPLLSHPGFSSIFTMQF